MSRQFLRKQIAAVLAGLVAGCLAGLETNCFAQTNQLDQPALPDYPELPVRTLRATNLTRMHLTNRPSPAAMEALVRVNAESERRRAAPPILQPLPPPNSGMQLPPRQINIVANRGPHTNLFGGATAQYEQVLSDPNLPPNLRKTYESLLNDTRQKAAEFQTNQQLWANLNKAISSRRTEDVDQAKRELADFLAAFSKRAYDTSYPAGTDLDVIIEDFKARAAVPNATPTNNASKAHP